MSDGRPILSKKGNLLSGGVAQRQSTYLPCVRPEVACVAQKRKVKDSTVVGVKEGGSSRSSSTTMQRW